MVLSVKRELDAFAPHKITYMYSRFEQKGTVVVTILDLTTNIILSIAPMSICSKQNT